MLGSRRRGKRANNERATRAKLTVPPLPRRDFFGTFSAWTAKVMGGRAAFALALLSVVAWACTGPIFRYSQDWQLVINTSTTIVTFLMVFLIQNSQNRESKATHLKLDELIHAVKRADNRLICVEELSEAQLNAIAQRYQELARQSQERHEAETAALEGDTGSLDATSSLGGGVGLQSPDNLAHRGSASVG
jgi:low affinity Fe/Cu permease